MFYKKEHCVNLNEFRYTPENHLWLLSNGVRTLQVIFSRVPLLAGNRRYHIAGIENILLSL